jgi:phytoene/squalene synthetase
MHKQRYLAALKLPAHMRPPVCLRYAMWALAATFSDKYSQYEDLLYERARRYAEAAEMKVRPHIQLGLRTHAEVHRAMARVLSRFNMPKHGY